MEYVSVLAGERFTDRPRCVDRRLAGLARAVNDVLGDTARPRLALLAPALIGTVTPAATGSSAGTSGARRWLARVWRTWLLATTAVEVFIEVELRRHVMDLADALRAAGYSQPAVDEALIELLAEAVAAHRENRQLSPAAIGVVLQADRPLGGVFVRRRSAQNNTLPAPLGQLRGALEERRGVGVNDRRASTAVGPRR